MNAKELRRITGAESEDLFSEMAEQFLHMVPDYLAELSRTAADGDIASVKRQAHKLLGLCRQIGAQRMAAVCCGLDAGDADKLADGILDSVNLLSQEFDTARKELQEKFG